MARLLFYKGAVDNNQPPLFIARMRQTRTRIGRVDDCDVVLPDNQISRSHAVIDQVDNKFELFDRSSNGTFLNGERVARAQLSHGDELRVGGFAALVDLYDTPAGPTDVAQPENRHEELLEAGEGRLAVSGAVLVVVHGPGEGLRVPLKGGRISVGAFGSRVMLPDPTVVRDHARLRLVSGRVMVEPGQGAAFLGATRVRELMPVYPGEEIRIGGTEFEIQWEDREEKPEAEHFGEMVGMSTLIRRAFGALRRMAASHVPVLILGESGTGKELAARAIHDASPRAGSAFVAINCGAITPALFESELFGHEKGSFTGAANRKDGAFHRADGGTLFLDEIGELSEEAQVKLLRALESGEVRRVGSTEVTYPDVRIVAATNRNLHESAKGEGSFRKDLYFRLAVLTVRLPALRERPEDIPLMADAIGKRIHPSIQFTPEALRALQEHPWPGNGRELRNVITRAYVLHGARIDVDGLEFYAMNEAFSPVTAVDSLTAIDITERQVVQEAMEEAHMNRSLAARILGIPRSTLLYKLRKWGLD